MKHPDMTTSVEWKGGSVVPELKALTAKSRLYIVGHGVEDGKKVAGLTGEEMAAEIVEVGGLSAQVGLISLACCYAGKEATGFMAGLRNLVNPSFARSFHKSLGETHKIYTVVHARPLAVTIGGTPKTPQKAIEGRKFGVVDPNDLKKGVKYKEPGSKYKYEWKGTEQVVTPVYG